MENFRQTFEDLKDWRVCTSLQIIAGLCLLLNGISRLVVVPFVHLNFLSDEMYGALGIFVGSYLVFGTLFIAKHYVLRRIASLLGSALLFSWAFDLGYPANAFWFMIVLATGLFVCAIRR